MSKWNRFMDRGPSGWRRVSRDRVCPVCGRPDWCGVSYDARFAVCMRTGEGAMQPTSNGGYLHRLGTGGSLGNTHGRADKSRRGNWRRSNQQGPTPPRPAIDWAGLHGKMSAAVMPASLAALSRELGVSSASLIRLGIGWQQAPGAWAFPMVGPGAQTCGIRLRGFNGRKWSVKGSRTGVFWPTGLPLDQYGRDLLLIAEGPTDTAALLDLGYAAIGRPDCASRAREIARFASRLTRGKVVVVSDRDEPGQRGAKALLQQLWGCAISARGITPPDGVKDARDWVRQGATYEDVAEQIIRAYQPKRGQRFYKSGGAR